MRHPFWLRRRRMLSINLDFDEADTRYPCRLSLSHLPLSSLDHLSALSERAVSETHVIPNVRKVIMVHGLEAACLTPLDEMPITTHSALEVGALVYVFIRSFSRERCPHHVSANLWCSLLCDARPCFGALPWKDRTSFPISKMQRCSHAHFQTPRYGNIATLGFSREILSMNQHLFTSSCAYNRPLNQVPRFVLPQHQPLPARAPVHVPAHRPSLLPLPLHVLELLPPLAAPWRSARRSRRHLECWLLRIGGHC